MQPSILLALFPGPHPDAVVIESVNNPVQLPAGGTVAMDHRVVTDETGEQVEIDVCRICIDHEYIIYRMEK